MKNTWLAFESACRAGWKAFKAQYRRRRTQLRLHVNEDQF